MILAMKNGVERRDFKDVHMFVEGRTPAWLEQKVQHRGKDGGRYHIRQWGLEGNTRQRKVIPRSNSIYAFLPQVAKHWNSTGYTRVKMSIYHLISNCNKYGTNYSP